MTCTVREVIPKVGEVIRNCRGDRTLAAFGAEIGVGRQWVYQWESGNQQPSDKTLQAWWDDHRDWVQKMALDVLAAKFAGIREAFLAELAEPAPAANGKQAQK